MREDILELFFQGELLPFPPQERPSASDPALAMQGRSEIIIFYKCFLLCSSVDFEMQFDLLNGFW